jgi:hypothetical protein
VDIIPPHTLKFGPWDLPSYPAIIHKPNKDFISRAVDSLPSREPSCALIAYAMREMPNLDRSSGQATLPMSGILIFDCSPVHTKRLDIGMTLPMWMDGSGRNRRSEMDIFQISEFFAQMKNDRKRRLRHRPIQKKSICDSVGLKFPSSPAEIDVRFHALKSEKSILF